MSRGELPSRPSDDVGSSHTAEHESSSAQTAAGASNGIEIKSTTSDVRSSVVVHKGAYRGSPVVDVRLATDVNHTTVKALRSLGPSDFQAVREIGQGAFGKVWQVQILLCFLPQPIVGHSCAAQNITKVILNSTLHYIVPVCWFDLGFFYWL